MRVLLPPSEGPTDPLDVYAATDRHAPGRPWVMLNMVASADGATAVDGVSGSLGGAPDRRVFHALRTLPDVVLAAAGTVRAEGYGPPRAAPEVQAARTARGQAPVPRLAVVTASLDLDPAARFFTEAVEAPVVVTTTDADPARRAALAPVAEVVEAGAGRVDLAGALAALGRLGARLVLCEGGPSLNGQLVADDLVDELSLTIAPDLVGGGSARVAHGAVAAVRTLELAHVLEEDGVLVLHYLRRR